jgi:Uma2 family endonuclease
MGTKTLMSLEDFVQLPDDDMRHELDEGELIVMPPAKFRHSRIAKRIYDSILAYLVARRMRNMVMGEVFSEAGYELERTAQGRTVRQPDVSYVHVDRLKAAPDAYMEGAPDLAIEVVSPSDTAEQMARKVRQYLGSGGEVVWVVYPASSEVHAFYSPERVHGTAGGNMEAKIFSQRDVLTEPELLPGWDGIALAELFA